MKIIIRMIFDVNKATKIIILTILLFTIAPVLLAFKDTDSLKHLLEQFAGKKRIELLIELAKKYEMVAPNKGLKYSQEAIAQSYSIASRKLLSESFFINAKLYYAIGSPDSSEYYYNKALILFRKLNDSLFTANCLSNIGNVYYSIGEYALALRLYDSANTIYRTINKKSSIAKNDVNIGNISLILGNTDSSLVYYLKAYELFNKLKDEQSMAHTLMCIGDNLVELGNYKKAVEYYNKSLSLFNKLDDRLLAGKNLSNIGIVHWNLGDLPKALSYLLKSLSIAEKVGDKNGMADNYTKLGIIYSELNENNQSVDYYRKAQRIYKETGNKNNLATLYSNIADIYQQEKNYDSALILYKTSLKIFYEIGNRNGYATILINIGYLNLSINKITESLNNFDSAYKIFNSTGDKNGIALSLLNIGSIYYYNKGDIKKSFEFLIQAEKTAKETGDQNLLIKIYKLISNVYFKKGNFKSAFEHIKLYSELMDSKYDEDKSIEIGRIESKRELQLKDQQIMIQNLKIARKRYEQIAMFGGIGLLLIVISFVAYQRRQSEKLLLNILPHKIALRLKRKEKPIADHFNDASIVFIDFVEFTTYSQDKNPDDVVELLNEIFIKFDSLAEKHGLEKIKTIGDCYMAVAGVPDARNDHAVAAARFALDAFGIFNSGTPASNTEIGKNSSQLSTLNSQFIRFRCGIDCGPVVAGVIGEKKFTYDLWGDAVNTAARMQEYGIAGRIQVTERFKSSVVSDKFNFEERGVIEIKGKGKMRTWFLNG